MIIHEEGMINDLLHLRSYMGDIAATGSTWREVNQMKSFVITRIETNKRSENEQNMSGNNESSSSFSRILFVTLH